MGKKKATAAGMNVNSRPLLSEINSIQQSGSGGNSVPSVDSWRSYKSDTTKLQSLATYRHPNWNVRASPFEPAQSETNSIRSQPVKNLPLRISNRNREKLIPQPSQTTADISSSQAVPRYSFRSKDTADKPLPSIEKPGNISKLAKTEEQQQRFLPRPNSVPRGSTPRRAVTPPPAPTATEMYLQNAQLPPAVRSTPQKLLIVLDLNGTLIVRPNSKTPTRFNLRPGVTPLLEYLFENHVVMIYTSAQPQNALVVVEKLLHPKYRQKLAAIWCRDKLGLSYQQYNNKVQVYKKLVPVWADATIQRSAGKGQTWDQSNTVLIDDSQLKALSEPHNLLQIPEFLNDAPKQDDDSLRKWQQDQMMIMKSVEEKLEVLKWQVDVSRLIFKWQTGQEVVPGVVDESVDHKTAETEQEPSTSSKPAPDATAAKTSIPSPESIAEFLRTNMSSHLPTVNEVIEISSDESEPDQGGVKIRTANNTKTSRDSEDTADSTDKTGGSSRVTSSSSFPAHSRVRSESPIAESVWTELLSGGVEGAEHKGSQK